MYCRFRAQENSHKSIGLRQWKRGKKKQISSLNTLSLSAVFLISFGEGLCICRAAKSSFQVSFIPSPCVYSPPSADASVLPDRTSLPYFPVDRAVERQLIPLLSQWKPQQLQEYKYNIKTAWYFSLSSLLELHIIQSSVLRQKCNVFPTQEWKRTINYWFWTILKLPGVNRTPRNSLEQEIFKVKSMPLQLFAETQSLKLYTQHLSNFSLSMPRVSCLLAESHLTRETEKWHL